MTGAVQNSSPGANYSGAFWILGAAFFGSGLSAIAKVVGADFSAVEVAFFRAFIGLIVTMPFILRSGRAGWISKQPLLQATRGVLASVVMLCGFYAVVEIPLADFTVLAFTKVLFVVIFASIILRERIHMRRTIATLVGFLGVLIIVRPTGTVDFAVLVVLFGALVIAINIVLVKVVSRTDGPVTLVLYSNIVQCLVLAAPAAYYWVTPNLEQLLGLVSIGILGTVVQLCIVRGYAVAEASAVISFDYTRILFAVALGYVFFDEIPDGWTLAGASVIIVSTVYIARREARIGKSAPAPGILDQST